MISNRFSLVHRRFRTLVIANPRQRGASGGNITIINMIEIILFAIVFMSA